MKLSKKLTICFALFEKVDYWVIKDTIKKLEKTGMFNVLCFNGLSYDKYVHNNKKINSKIFPRAISEKKILLRPARMFSESIFSFLINEKIHCLETRVLFKRVYFEKNRISKACKKCEFFIIPEDTDSARGRLVAAIAKAYRRRALVFLPLYYDWITTHPLCDNRIANYWILCGNNYRLRLLRQNIKANNIYTSGINIVEKNKNCKSKPQKLLQSKPYYLVALQDNEEQEAAICFVIDAIKYMYNKAIFFKYHPSTSGETKKYLRERYSKDNVRFLDKIALGDVIKRSLGLITYSSTTILDAVYYKKPVMVINTGYFFHELYLLGQRTKAFKFIENPKSLSDLARSLDNEEFRKKYVRKQAVLAKEYFSDNRNNPVQTTRYLISRILNEK